MLFISGGIKVRPLVASFAFSALEKSSNLVLKFGFISSSDTYYCTSGISLRRVTFG